MNNDWIKVEISDHVFCVSDKESTDDDVWQGDDSPSTGELLSWALATCLGAMESQIPRMLSVVASAAVKMEANRVSLTTEVDTAEAKFLLAASELKDTWQKHDARRKN